MRYVESLREALLTAFRADDRAFLLGEDVLDPYGGAFKVTQGLSSRHPERVFTTPISEAGIVGVGVGMALRGLHPVVEIMFGDFLTLCADQLINHAAKFGEMYGRPLDLPLVVRTAVGAGRGYGPTHSQSLERLFFGVSQMTVVAPTHAHDCGELLKRAICVDTAPVLFVEHKLLYPMELIDATQLGGRTVPEANGYPTVQLRNFASGPADATVIGYGGMSRPILEAMDMLAREEIRVEVILPSSVTPVPYGTLCDAATGTGRVVLVEEGSAAFGWTGEVAAGLYERLWRRLKAPIQRVGASPMVIPSAKHLEDQVVVTSDRVVASVLAVLE